MTINDHDQFTGLNAVHVAASEGNVKRLVELMDDGAELDVPALGGSISSSRSLSFSLSRFFFSSMMMSLRDDDDDRFFFVCVLAWCSRGCEGLFSRRRWFERRRGARERERGWKTRDSSSRTTVLTCALLILINRLVPIDDKTKQNSTENAGKTAAMIAAGAGHVDVLKAMQRGPSMLNLKAADGGTPAMSAAVHGYKEVLDYLISKKVDLNAQDEDGWTALHFAVMANAASSVKALLAAGVRTDIKNSDGDTAAGLAQGSKAGIKKLFGSGSSKRLAGVKEGKKGCIVM